MSLQDRRGSRYNYTLYEDETVCCCQLDVHKKRIREYREKYTYDPDFQGPARNRSCTDVLCLLFFLVAIAVWVGIGIFAFVVGDPRQLIAPRDSENKVCGFDSGVQDKPYLVFFDISECAKINIHTFHCNTPQVCVESCPASNYVFDYYKQYPAEFANLNIQSLVCKDDVNKGSIKTISDLKTLTDSGQCAGWFLSSIDIAHRCLPTGSSNVRDITVDVGDGQWSIPGVTWEQISNASGVVHALSAVNEFGHAVVQDLSKTWPWIVISLVMAAAASLLVIILMRWLSGVMVWVSLIGCLVLLGFCCYYTWIKYQDILNNPAEPASTRFNLPSLSSTSQQPFAGSIGYALDSNVWEELKSQKETWLTFFILSCIALGINLLIIIFLRNRIRLAIALIDEASKSIGSSWSSLVFPIFPWIIQVGVICYYLVICLFLFSAGVPVYRVSGLVDDRNCQCSPQFTDTELCIPDIFQDKCRDTTTGGACQIAGCFFATQETKTLNVYLQFVNLFLFLWTLFFISGIADLILSSVFAQWYWTFQKKDIPFFIVLKATCRTIRYHMGTAAFGSLLLALVRWIRFMIEIVYKAITKHHENCCIKIVKCFCACFFWCLEKFLRLISRNSYIMCSIHGKNFCLSAVSAFNLLARNAVRVAVLDNVTGFLFFLAKLMITAGMGAFAFYIFSRPMDDFKGSQYQPQYYFISIVLVSIGTYFIASIFFNVFCMAVDTLFLCFLEDCERNDGSLEKPYFMSSNLMRILGKKNKKMKE